ncbi:lipocalin/cytosolic fatty-acid binding protein family protein [Loa loa]|uniref:Lipocalin/cytosolic fatty-acid binding protein family protein n=1 Tax=Loa loa TaxID=7209 RepID=A0A1I7VQY4_LOALO|nr:lipocalin/cytosolic fatty-acid binding protein family protein [Loa loa]EFO26414.1 lipocalin/cytosolic fatty-acid binding protein family protein [Loa loa]
MAVAEKFVGIWTFVESENFDAYLKQIGVGLIMRSIARNLKPTLTFSVDGNKWKIVSESSFRKHVWEFELGEEFVETTPDGRQVKSKFFLEGDILVQLENAIKADGKSTRFERYIDKQGQLIIVCDCEGVVAKRIYKSAE